VKVDNTFAGNEKMSIFIKKLLQLLILSLISLAALGASAGVVDTKHNLAHWSPYAFRAVTEDRVCVFCHTPHNASPAGPLWSHALTEAGVTFKKYSSPTLQILVDPTARSESGYDTSTITGATKLCLGCHDGLTALGAITTGGGSITIEMDTGKDVITGSSSYKEDASNVNIQNKHPVSFIYNTAVKDAINAQKQYAGANTYGFPGANENETSKNDEVQKMLDAARGRVECTICHDPHENKASNNRDLLSFWISGSYTDATFGGLSSYEGVCLSCHRRAYGEYTTFEEYTSYR